MKEINIHLNKKTGKHILENSGWKFSRTDREDIKHRVRRHKSQVRYIF